MPTDGKHVIVNYLIGSTIYKQQNQTSFDYAIERCQLSTIEDAVFRCHLSGLLHSRLPREKQSQRFQSQIIHDRIAFNSITEILQCIGSRTSQCDPILLKGVGLWFQYYGDPIERRIRDVDICIPERRNLSTFCQVLEDEGFQTTEEDCLNEAVTPNYELNERVKYITLNVDNDTLSSLKRYDSTYYHPIAIAAESEVRIKCVVEPHIAPFVFGNGSFPVIGKDDLYSHKIKGFLSLKAPALLAYLSIKIVQDLQSFLSGETVKSKAIKLIGDFVRILENVNQEELNQTFRKAAEWNCATHLWQTFSEIEYLTPEFNFVNLPSCRTSLLQDSLELI